MRARDGPHLPKAANRQAYFEDFERRELFMTFPGMDRLASDDERKALASYWSALIQANLGENYDAPADRLRFANYRRVKRTDGADDVDDGELSPPWRLKPTRKEHEKITCNEHRCARSNIPRGRRDPAAVLHSPRARAPRLSLG